VEPYPPPVAGTCDTPAAELGELPGSQAAFARSRKVWEEMTARLGSPELLEATQAGVEDYLTHAGRELQRQLLQDHLDLRAAVEVRQSEATGADGVARRRVQRGRRRRLATTVGPVEVTRISYRAEKASALHPADAALALPAALYSHPLRRAVVHEVATGSLRQARDALVRSSGVHLGTRQLMEICTSAAADVTAFYALRDHLARIPTVTDAPERAGTDKQLLVLSVDATGVSMIPADLREPTRAAAAARASAQQPPSAQLSARDKPGRRRMATVTACFDAEPAKRTPADILPATTAERAQRAKGPVTSGRVVHASLTHSPTEMIHDLFDQSASRDPEHKRRWVALVDGNNHQIDRIRHEAVSRGVDVTIVIDIVHVIEYCWRAAEDLHRSHPARANWVQATVRAILDGHSARIVAELRAEHAARARTRQRKDGIARTLAYLDAKQPYLAYHIALALGFPIATGVIEGCCRFLVKDRLDLTGARWSLTGAEAVLALRAVLANNDMDAYWTFHLEREYERTHAIRYQGQLALAA
jgi:hypothetical protein